MTTLRRGMVIDVNLDPTLSAEQAKTRPCIIVTNDIYNQRVPIIQVVPLTAWNDKKARIATNIVLEPTAENGLSKRSVADCLQTRPIDHQIRMVRVRGKVSVDVLKQIDNALKMVFTLE